MRVARYALALIACVALVFALGSVGAYEAGHISLGGMVAQCGASLTALWGSLYVRHKSE